MARRAITLMDNYGRPSDQEITRVIGEYLLSNGLQALNYQINRVKRQYRKVNAANLKYMRAEQAKARAEHTFNALISNTPSLVEDV